MQCKPLRETQGDSYRAKYTRTILSGYHTPGRLPRGVENHVHTEICTGIFIAVLVIGKTWKQLKCPSVGGGQVVGHPHNEYYSAVKGNELSSHEETWRSLHCTSLERRLHAVDSNSVTLEQAAAWTPSEAGSGGGGLRNPRMGWPQPPEPDDFLPRPQMESWGAAFTEQMHLTSPRGDQELPMGFY